MYAKQLNSTNEDKKRILTKALVRLANQLELSRRELSSILETSESSLSRRFTEKPNYYIDPASGEGRSAILLLRIYRNLDALFGGNIKQCQLWLRSGNKHLGSVPLQLMQSREGLVLTALYLDAMRGKN